MPKRVPAKFPANLPCKIAFIGDAPGDEELSAGVPFAGPAGKLFDNMLRMANIRREDCLLTGVLDTPIPENDIANLLGDAAERKTWKDYNLPPLGKAGWLRPEYIPALDRLTAELTRAGPNVIVPCGNFALWAMTGFYNIMARRGAVHEATMTMPGAKLLPVLHPASILKQFKMYSVTSADFVKIAREAEYPDIRTTKRELWLEPTFEDIRMFKRLYLDRADYIVVDIETFPSRRQITCIGFAASPERAICIPFVDERKPNRSYWSTAREEIAVWGAVKEIMESDIPKIGHNFTYDSQWLFDLLRIKSMNYSEDTRLLAHALYPEMRKDLGTLGAMYANERAWKLGRVRHEEGEKKDD